MKTTNRSEAIETKAMSAHTNPEIFETAYFQSGLNGAYWKRSGELFPNKAVSMTGFTGLV